MNAELLDRIGDRNPQLYRELKGKLKGRNIIVAVIAAFAFQAVLVLANTSESHGLREIDWQQIYRILNWLLPVFGIASGVYLISRDLCQEQTRGTLNFVLLSPQPSANILLGKLLGVPILLYLSLAPILLLHLIACSTLIAGLPAHRAVFALFGVYPVWVAVGSLYYSLAAVLAIANPKGDLRLLPAATSLLALETAPMAISLVARPDWMTYPGLEGTGWNWFFLPESFGYIWLLATLFALNLGLWQLLNSSFRNPYGSAMNKVQSYWTVGGINLWLLGFALPDAIADSGSAGSLGTFNLLMLVPLTSLLMTAILSPPRQTLLDWARYRHLQSEKKRGLLRDLLLSEQSPAPVALALHWAIAAIVWLPWFVPFVNSQGFQDAIANHFLGANPLRLILSFCLTAILFLIYATVYQSVRFHAKNLKQESTLATPWFAAILAPAIVATLFQLSPERVPVLWLFSPVPFLGAPHASIPTLLAVMLGQLAFLGFLARRLQKQITRAGASEFKIARALNR